WDMADGSSLLVVDNITVHRGGVPVIENASLTMEAGEFVGIVGPNGGGKSTFVQAILGVLKCHAGSVRLKGHAPMSDEVIGSVAWVSQAAANLPKSVRLTVRELVSLGTMNKRTWLKPRDLEIRERGIGLSGGQRQRAVIARALASQAEFLVLDEPLVGLDRASRNTLLRLLDRFCHDQNKTILMVSHDITAMRQTAHRLIYLEDTIRFDGPPPLFPSLEELASLRGIDDVHGGHHHDHSEAECTHDHSPRTITVGELKEAE
ncbi:MAG: metal ABC transporter ATP-binding protein, partial [Poseidonia sp.]